MKFSEFKGGLFMFNNRLFLKINELKVSHGICAIQLNHEQNKIVPNKLINSINYFTKGIIDPVSCSYENVVGTQTFSSVEVNSLFMYKDKDGIKDDILSLRIDPAFVNNIVEGLELKNGEFIMYTTQLFDHIQQMRKWPVQKVIKFELN